MCVVIWTDVKVREDTITLYLYLLLRTIHQYVEITLCVSAGRFCYSDVGWELCPFPVFLTLKRTFGTFVYS